jgi:hypothetical protein|tara:strand:+ start:2180 stop:3070 length:891 start_codon:yes stop_codon:yes gene_type:complete
MSEDQAQAPETGPASTPTQSYSPLDGNGEGVPADEVLSIFSSDMAPAEPTAPDPILQPEDGITPEAPVQPVDPTVAPQQPPAPMQQPSMPTTGPDPLTAAAAALTTAAEKIGQGGQAQEPQVPAYEKVPDYGYNIPDEIMGMLVAEEPSHRKQAQAAIATGISRQVHETVMKNVKSMISDAVLPAVSSRIQEAQAAQEVFRDFYTTHEDLSNPAYRSVIEQVAKQHMNGNQGGWTPELRDRIATSARQLLNMQPGVAPLQPLGTPPPVITGNGARGGTGHQVFSEQDEIADLVKMG